MILWGRPSSVNVQKVLWAFTELGSKYEHRIVGGKYGGMDDPAFTKLTPIKRVPVLQEGDRAIWESHAILRYLANADITPEVDTWMEFGSTTLQPPFLGLFWQRVRMTAEQQNADILARHEAALRSGSEILNAGLSDGRMFIAGEKFTMADVALGSLFYRITDLYPNILDDHTHVQKWHKEIAKRDGYRQWVATSYDELKVAP